MSRRSLSAVMGEDAVPPPDLSRVGEVCSLGTLLEALVERSHHKLLALGSSLRGQPEAKRQEELLRYIHGYRQQLLRLLTVVRWLQRDPSSANNVAYSRLVLDTTSRHQGILQETADKLFFLWRDELQVFRAPIYDIPIAYQVMTTGTCTSLPTCVEDLCGEKLPTMQQKLAAARRMNMLLRCCLLDSDLPEGIRVIGTSVGVATLCAEGKYKIGLTLLPAPEEEPAPADAAPEADVAQGQESEAAAAGADGKVPQKGADAAGAALPNGDLANGDLGSDVQMKDATSTKAAAEGNGAEGEEQQQQQQQQERDQEPSWRWCITEITMLPGSARVAQLTSLQHDQLRQVLQAQMWEAAKEAEAKERAPAGQQIDSGAAVQIKQDPGQDVEMAEAAAEQQQQTAEGGKKAVYSAPLALMHRLLSDIASRLLVDGLVSTARALAKEGGSWHGSLRVSPLSEGRSGVALSYWQGVPPLVPAPVWPRGDYNAVPELPPPPELQLELKDRDVVPSHIPELADPLTSRPVTLALEPLAADASQLLNSAATANAWVQLHAVLKEMNGSSISAGLRAAGGSVELKQHAPQPEKAAEESTGAPRSEKDAPSSGATDAPSSPCIEMKAEGAVLLVLQIDLRTGKLVLKPGHGLGGEGGMDVAMVLKAEEAKLQQAQANPAAAQQLRSRTSSSAAAPVDQRPPATALEVVAERLVTLFQRLAMRDHLAQLMVACRSLRLQYMPGVPRHLFEACTAAGSRGPAYYLAFPPMPLPLGFPLHKIRGFGSSIARAASRLLQTQVIDADISSPGAGANFNEAVALRFHLGVDNIPRNSGPEGTRGRGPSPMSRYVLFVSTASYRGTALQAIRRIIVPQSALEEALKNRSGSSSSSIANDSGGGSPGEAPGAARSKRKREDEDEEEKALEVKAKAEDEAEGGNGREEDPWGLQQMEELAGAVFWCQRQLIWELIRAQLDALQVSYSEEVIMPKRQQAGSTESAAPSGGFLGRRINLLGLEPLSSQQQETRAALEVESPEEHPEGRWHVSLSGDFLHSESSTTAAEVAELPRGPGERVPQHIDGGLRLSYSLVDGHSLLDTLGDVERTVRCAAMVRRMRALLGGSAAAAAAAAKAAEPVVKEELTRRSTAPLPLTRFEGTLGKGPYPAPAASAFPGCGEVSISGVGLMSMQLDWVPPRGLVKGRSHSTHSDNLLGVGPLRLMFQWVCETQPDQEKDRSPSVAPRFSMPRISCQVTSQPPVLQGALSLLGEMVMDGEEGLMIDALRCCAPPLLVLSEAAKPGALRCTIVAECNSSPYSVNLLLQSPKTPPVQHRVTLRFFARGSVWLCLHPPHQETFQPLPELTKLLSELGKINQEFNQRGGGPMPLVFNGKIEEPAIWVHTTMLDQVLQALISHVGHAGSS